MATAKLPISYDTIVDTSRPASWCRRYSRPPSLVERDN